MEMPKVTKEHEKLHVFAGRWVGDEVMHPSPMGPGGAATGEMNARVDVDGFFVISDYVQRKTGGSGYKGHGVYGYDAHAGEYTWYWVDSMGFPSVPSRGKWVGDTLTFESSHPNGKGRYIYRWEGTDTHHFRIENSFDGGATWTTFMEATYRRQR
jgi:hypothetical protein